MTFAEGITPLQPSGKICLCVYGRPGVGKTALIGSSTQRVLILRPPMDHVDSILTVHGPKPFFKEKIIRGWNDMDDAANYMRDARGKPDVDWVWLDSISLFQDTGLDDIWANVLASPKGAHRKVHGLDKGEYGTNMERISQWVRQMISLPGFHLGITAHPMQVMDAETDELVMMPFIQGKDMAPKIAGYMNIVGHYVLKDRARILRTTSHNRYYAKDDFGVLGTMRNPTLDQIVAKTRGRIARPNRPVIRPARSKRRTSA
jgi:hypothetical protein